MNDENHTAPETINSQENNGYDISKMLEMAKLFSTLINNNPPKENNPTPVKAPNPIVYTNGTILFDETIHTPRLKVIKTAIPYLEPNYQRILGVFVKAVEFKKVIDIYKNPENPLSNMALKSKAHWKTEMLNSFKPHCSEENQYILDMMIKVMDIGELMKKINSLKITEDTKKLADDSEKKNTKQRLLETLSPLLDDSQKQMLNLFANLME